MWLRLPWRFGAPSWCWPRFLTWTSRGAFQWLLYGWGASWNKQFSWLDRPVWPSPCQPDWTSQRTTCTERPKIDPESMWNSTSWLRGWRLGWIVSPRVCAWWSRDTSMPLQSSSMRLRSSYQTVFFNTWLTGQQKHVWGVASDVPRTLKPHLHRCPPLKLGRQLFQWPMLVVIGLQLLLVVPAPMVKTVRSPSRWMATPDDTNDYMPPMMDPLASRPL